MENNKKTCSKKAETKCKSRRRKYRKENVIVEIKNKSKYKVVNSTTDGESFVKPYCKKEESMKQNVNIRKLQKN